MELHRFYLVVNFSLFVFLAVILRPLFGSLRDLSLAEVSLPKLIL